ncbi:hypothetical protein IAT40_006895 [Kwoniella sp. CBS 6097]
MEVDTDRIATDDERMDEDYPVGEGEGMMEDSDGDEMMGDEIQDDQEYEEAMDEENMEPELHTVRAKETEVVPPADPVVSGGMVEPPIPFTPTETPPVVTPFPEPASAAGTAGFFGQASGSGSGSGSGTSTARPLESPPAPETEMTPAPQDGVNSHTAENAVGPEEVTTSTSSEEQSQSQSPLNIDNEGKEHVSHPPQTVATTEEALDVLNSHPSAFDPTSAASQPVSSTEQDTAEMPANKTSIPTVPEPHGGVSVEAGSFKRAFSRETTPRQERQGPSHADGDANIQEDEHGAHDDEYYDEEVGEEDVGEEEEEEDDEDYPIDVLNLPPIIIHLPQSGARSLFVPYESDPDTLPIWLQDRQEELGEASLADVWEAIRAECIKDGLAKNGALVITEKQMDLKMNEDDLNLQSITFLELITLHHECGLPEPVQLYLTWEESRFVTRFNAIQMELEAVKRRRSESAQIEEDENKDEPVVGGQEEKQGVTADVQTSAAAVATPSASAIPAAASSSSSSAPVTRPAVKHAEPIAESDQGDYEEYDEEGYAEDAKSVGADGYSDAEQESKAARAQERAEDRERRREGRDVKAEYADSNDDKNTRDLEREHPQWAEARARPTDALHFEGPPANRHIIYHETADHEPAAPEADAEPKPEPESFKSAKHPDVKGGEEVDAEEENEEYDEEEEREEGDEDDAEGEEGGEWNDEAGTVDSTHEQTDSKRTEGEDDMQATVPVPVRLPRDQIGKLRAEQQSRLLQLQHEGLGQQQEVGSVIAGSGAALPTPAAGHGTGAHAPSDTSEIGDHIPLDEVALKHKHTGIPESSAEASPEISILAGDEGSEEVLEDNDDDDDNGLIQTEVPLDEVALKLEDDAAQDESAAISPVGSSREVSEFQFQSPFATPAETTPVGTEISMTASEVGGAHVIADRVLGADDTAFRRPDVIPEEEDEITISEREEIVNDRAERQREAEELPGPVDGVAGAAIVPEPVNENEADASYEDDENPGSEEFVDEGYDGEYDESDLPGTMPVTPLHMTETGEGSLKFYPQGHPDADDPDEAVSGEIDEGYSEEYEEEGSERTLEEDDSWLVTADPTMTESGDTDYPETSTVDDTLSMPPSAKRTLDDDESMDSKRARTDEASE